MLVGAQAWAVLAEPDSDLVRGAAGLPELSEAERTGVQPLDAVSLLEVVHGDAERGRAVALAAQRGDFRDLFDVK